jgi:hypothetical protein
VRGTCSIEGCDVPHFGRGWCRTHWQRWSRHGDPLYEHKPRPVLDRLWARVERTPTCWLWTGAVGRAGYGQIRLGPRGTPSKLVHVLAWEAERGPVPQGWHLHHECETPACVRPSHLRPITPTEHQRLHAAARTMCRHGHPLDGLTSTGKRFCRTCKRLSDRRYHARKRVTR